MYRFSNKKLTVFLLFFGCFLGLSLTCVAFRVNFANVRFTGVQRGFVRSTDVTKYMSFIFFEYFYLAYFCFIFEWIWGPFWNGFVVGSGMIFLESQIFKVVNFLSNIGTIWEWIFEPTWGRLGTSWDVLGGSWGVLGASWECLGGVFWASWERLGSGNRLGTVFEPF